MYINFAKARLWVAAGAIVPYFAWCTREAGSGLHAAAVALWNPFVHARLPSEIEIFRRRALASDVTLDWIRFPTDGTRTQVFDYHRRLVCHLSKNEAGTVLISAELMTRAETGKLAPPVLALCDDGSGFVEKWVESRPAPFDPRILASVLAQLSSTFYRIEQLRRTEYAAMLRAAGTLYEHEQRLADSCLDLYSGSTFPVTQVHGDLVAHNVRVAHDGFVLLDWEYSRHCLATYDAWLYLYHGYPRGPQGLLPAVFFDSFHAMLASVGLGISVDDLRCLHVLHILERLAFLRRCSADGSTGVRRTMETDLLRSSVALGLAVAR